MISCDHLSPTSHHLLRKSMWWFLALLLAISPSVYAQKPKTPHQDQAKKLLASKAYGKAIQLLKGKKATAENLFLLSRAQFLAKKYKESASTAQTLYKTFPKSSFAVKVILQAAESLALAKQHKGAQKIYAAHLKKLLSNKRRLEIAQIYLRYADRYSKKTKKNKHSRYRKAINFYKKALDLGLPSEQKRRVYLRMGNAQIALGSTWYAYLTFRKAVSLFKKGKYADHFVYRFAFTQYRRSYRRSARTTLLDMIKDHPKSTLLPKAYFLLAKTYGVPSKVSNSYLALGVDGFKQVVKRYPKHDLAVQAAFMVGQSYYNNRRYDDAIKAFQAFIQQFSGKALKHKKRFLPRARYNIALCYSQQKRFLRAIGAFQDFLKAHPTDRYWPNAQRQIVKAHYQNAESFFTNEKWQEAQKHYQAFLQRYPLDSRSSRIMSRLGEIAFRQKKYLPAIQAWKKLISKYPYSSWGRKAKWLVAQTYEQKLGQYQKAIQAYKKIRYWRYRYKARKAIKRLTSKGMSLLTKRIYTVKEGGFIHANIRNIKKLKIKLYHVDTETYFRKMRTFQGMTKLDIQLIRPDREWEFKIPNYKKYRLHKISIPLKSKTPRVSVIRVTGGGLEATTVAVVSDLQIITKSNRKALFVFALNSQTRKPVASARILVSDGKRIVFEGKTDASGVYRLRSKKLKSIGKLRILALQKGSIAASGSSLYGIYHSQGLKAAGLLYTDRPVYRPGEVVFIKGILRELHAGNFQIPSKPYLLEVSTPYGKKIFQKKLKPSSFGTLHTRFLSDSSSPLGTYKIVVKRLNGPHFYGSFQLKRYQLPKYQLSIKLPRHVYFRNQEIKGRIQVNYGFGAPAGEKTVRYSLGPIRKTGKTDAKGQLKFTFSTRELSLDRVWTLRANLSGENARSATKIWMRSTAFDLGLSTVRKVHAAGESFQITLRASDPKGKTYSPRVRFRWLKKVRSGSRWIEKQSGEKWVQLKKGVGSVTITIKKGGTYILRAETKDMWKKPVTVSCSVYISGQEDKQVLRLLSAKDQYQVGDKTTVTLLSRRSGPALLTYEGDEVIWHKLIPNLKKGSHKLALTFTQKLSPNFALRVALLHKQKLHTVHKEFVISRRLMISAAPKAKSLTPGSWAELRFRTKDQSGKPVSSELSVAVVDANLFQLYKDNTPKLSKIFYAFRRDLKMVTKSSNTFKHRAGSIKTATAILNLAKERATATVSAPAQKAAGGYRGYIRKRRYRKFRISNNKRGRLNTFGGKLNNAPSGQAEQPKEEGKKSFLKNLRTRFATTAYWNPSVKTDGKGFAVVRFKVPDNSTTWKVVVRGVGHPTQVGETQTQLVSRKDFLVELHAPGVLRESDSFTPKAVVHNQTGKALTVKLRLNTVGLGQTRTLDLKVPKGRSREVTFPVISMKGAGGKEVQLRLFAQGKAGKRTWKDSIQKAHTVLIPGVKLHAGHSGVAKNHLKFSLALPGKGPFKHPHLELRLGPLSPSWILELIRSLPSTSFSLPGLNAYRASLALTGLNYLKSLGKAKSPTARELRQQLARLARAVWIQQHYQGGWSYLSKRSHPMLSAKLFVVLVQAKKQWGIFSPANGLKYARTYLKRRFRYTYNDEAKATLLRALLAHPQGDQNELFTYAYRLYRKRASLSLEALNQLGISLLLLNRPIKAKRLAPFIEKHIKRIRKGSSKVLYRKYWRYSPIIQAAGGLEVLGRIAPRSVELAEGIAWLLKRRWGLSWPSLQLNARAVQALTVYYQKAKMKKVALKVQIRVNGKALKKVFSFRETSPTASIELPLANAGKPVQVEIFPKGIGSFRYSALLTGYSTKPDKKLSDRFHKIRRIYAPAYQVVFGKTIKPGFWVLHGRYKKWKNTISQLPIGEHTRVSLTIRRKSGKSADLIVDEPLPAGAMVLPSSISVYNGRYSIEDGRIRFFLRSGPSSWTIRYHLYGSFKGKFSAPATRVWSFANPQRFSLGKNGSLKVLAAGSKANNKHKNTPNELFFLGRAYYRAKKYLKARKYFDKLLTNYKLGSSYLRQAARIQLDIALRYGPHANIVKYFEILKEQSPDEVISFDKIVKVGRAYAMRKEYERAYMVYRATLDARFLKELKVAASLERENEFAAAMKFIQSLVRSYPDLRNVQEASYARAQSLFQKAEKSKKNQKKRADWLKQADQSFFQFVWMYPDHPSVDAASYARANVFVAQNKRAKAIRYLATIAKRYPKSGDLATMHYLQAYALYLQKEYSKALVLLHRVSTKKYPNGRGGLQKSKNRHLATYLIAQLYHAKNQLEKALTWYKKVKKRFPDASVQVKYFEKFQLRIPEITSIQPNKATSLKIKHQNLKKLKFLAYYVDLMKLYLLKKNLNAVTKINLAGIRPSYKGETALKLSRFTTGTHTSTLPLNKKGSYLVVLKSGPHEVSGIVLRTGLKLEVEQDASTGRVTAYLFNRKTRKPVPGAIVRIVGSRDGRFRSGKTDLRGIFSASGVRGTVTVITQKGDDFAFFRGKTNLRRSYYYRPATKKPQMRKNIDNLNWSRQREGRKRMRFLYQQKSTGVQMKSAY